MSITSKQRAPWDRKQLRNLRKWQNSAWHPFTCCSHNGCDRLNQPDQGKLIPTKDGWICPCGEWKQNWAHKAMIDGKIPPDPFIKYRKLPKLKKVLRIISMYKM